MTKNSNFFSEQISEKERGRLDRQLRLPEWNQEALKSSSVVIAGVGGLGTEIAKNLAMAGVGTLHLIDMDVIEYSNLNRQILFIEGDIGEPKAKIAAQNLKKINPFGRYIHHFSPLEDVDPVVYETADVIISGLDSVEARSELNRRAVHAGKPLIDGGTVTYYGHTYTHLPGKNACLECDPQLEPERETLAACTLVGIPRKRIHCLLKGQLFFESKFNRTPDVKSKEEMKIVLEYANDLLVKHFNQEQQFSYDEAVALIDVHDPTIITINAVIASLQSQEALKVIHKQKGLTLGHINDEYCVYNGLIGKFFYLKKPQNPKCNLCSSKAPMLEHIIVPGSTTFDSILRILTQKGYTFSIDERPSLYKIDTRVMESVNLMKTLKESGIRDFETLFLTATGKHEEEIEIYLKISYPKEEKKK